MSKKSIIALLIVFSFSAGVRSQSITLRPYLGFNSYKAVTSSTSTGNLDRTLNSSYAESKYCVGFSMIYSNQVSAFEVGLFTFSSPINFSISYPVVRSMKRSVRYDLKQLHLVYNRQLSAAKFNLSQRVLIIPVVSAGFSLGIVPPEKALTDDSFWAEHELYISNTDSSKYLEITHIMKRPNALNFGLLFKLGFIVKSHSHEILTIQSILHLGLNKNVAASLDYNFTELNYKGSVYSRGNYLGIQFSTPLITLWRKNKK